MMRRRRAIASLFFVAVAACSQPNPDVASCDEIAHGMADLVWDAAEAGAQQFAAEVSEAADGRRPDEPGVRAKTSDIVGTAFSLADGTPEHAGIVSRGNVLRESAQVQKCDVGDWPQDILRADLTAELRRRMAALDGEPTTVQYVTMNFVATLVAEMDGRTGQSSTESD